jgi:hypothetical protein
LFQSCFVGRAAVSRARAAKLQYHVEIIYNTCGYEFYMCSSSILLGWPLIWHSTKPRMEREFIYRHAYNTCLAGCCVAAG